MNKHLLLCAAIFAANASAAQNTASDSVLAPVYALFEAMKAADSVSLVQSFAPNARLQTVREKEGLVKVEDEQVAAFASAIGRMDRGAADEQISIGTMKMDGALAMVWTPYKFYFKGKFSHCGVNVFQLVRLSAGWKILSIIDTRRKTGCDI